MLRAVTKAVDEIVFTRVEMERSADPQQLAGKMLGPIPHRVILNARTALRTLLDEAHIDDVIVVAGSLYLLGEVRPMLEAIASARTTAPGDANSPM